MTKDQPIEVGDVVFSKCGHDGGKYYVVVKADENEGFYMIADGKARKVARPKRKKGKHLLFSGKIEGFSEREKTLGVSDPYLALMLRPYNDKLK